MTKSNPCCNEPVPVSAFPGCAHYRCKEIVETFGIEAVPVNLYNRNVYDDAEEAGRSIFEMTGAERDKG